ncbi:MAG: hypothetical protein WD696_05065 [Bryobacteraceae bacterium]
MRIARQLLLYGLLPMAVAGLDADLPSPAPTVRGIFPHGLQRGTSAKIEMTGANLHGAQSVDFAGRGVRAEILSSVGSKLTLHVSAEADAEVGRRDFWLTTERGVYVGVFDVGALPEVRETEPNDDWRKPQPLTLPVLVNGVIGAEDWDHFRFRAEAGEAIVFDVSAARHGSRLDAELAILDDRGNELVWVDDSTIFAEPHLEYTFEKAGEYTVRVGSLAGGPLSDYRLSVGRLPYVLRSLPAGLGAGQTTLITLSGSHLDLVDELWLGDRAAKGEILNRSSRKLEGRFRLPSDFKPGAYRIHASHRGLEIAIPTELRVSNLPEVTVKQPPVELAKALPVSASAVLNGAIEQPGASHYFRFQASAGETLVFRAESMKLGYHLDPTITVLDGEGQKLVFADDPGGDDRSDEFQLDPDLSFRCEKDGVYYAAIRDGMYRGGDSLVYRLTVQRTPPDFIVELRDPVKALYQGQKDTIQVRIRRRAGWNTPVEVWAEGLPPGIVAEAQSAEPKDSVVKDTCGVDRVIDGTIVLLPVRAESGASGHFDFKIKARGAMEGRTVEHEAIVRYQHAAAGYIYGPMEIQRARMTVAPAPRVLLGTPDVLTVKAGGSQDLKVSVRRTGEGEESELLIRGRNLPSGIRLAGSKVATGARDVVISISADGPAQRAAVILEAVDAAGAVHGESAPFILEVKPEIQARN